MKSFAGECKYRFTMGRGFSLAVACHVLRRKKTFTRMTDTDGIFTFGGLNEGQVALGVATQGSHRPVRAHIRAYGSSDAGFAIQQNAACPECYPEPCR